MHRRRTKFAKRVSRAATVVEARGVRATYDLHDRVGANRASRKRFRAALPVLDDGQREILDAVRGMGYAAVRFEEVFPDPARWEEIAQAGDAFIARTEAGLAAEASGESGGLRRTQAKDFVVRENAWGVTLPLDDPWLRLGLDARMLDLANTYLGLWSKLEYVDLWYTPPAGPLAPRASQRWHRDFNDRLLLKAFLYLVDVDETAGPFEYLPESFPGGRLGDVWPWAPGGSDAYPGDEKFAERLANEPVKTFTAPRGTMIFCNTAGFHRGGLAVDHKRVLATWTFASPAALKALSERNYEIAGDTTSLSPAARFAIA